MNKMFILLFFYIFFLSSHAFAMKRIHEESNRTSNPCLFTYPVILCMQTNQNQELKQKQSCSTYALAINSNYFKQEIGKNTTEFPLKKIIRNKEKKEIERKINIPEAESSSYNQVLDWLHNKWDDVQLTPKEIFILFRISKVEWQCNDQFLTEIFSKKIKVNNYTEEEKDILFDPPEDISIEIVSYEKIILRSFGEQLQKEFGSIGEIIEYWSDFRDLKLLAVKSIFSNNNFKTDTTNSLFSLIADWLVANDRIEDINLFFPFFNLKNFSRFYLVGVVKNLLQEFQEDWSHKPQKIHNLKEFYELALVASMQQPPSERDKDRAKKIGCDLENPPLFAHISDNAEKMFSFKCEYKKLSTWNRRDKYHSHNIISNGYFFNFFVIESQAAPDLPALLGYLRCITTVTKKHEHYLPLDITIQIERRQGEPRTIALKSVLFDHYKKLRGIALTKPDEDSTKMRLCEAPYDQPSENDIVIDDTLSVIITVEFQ